MIYFNIAMVIAWSFILGGYTAVTVNYGEDISLLRWVMGFVFWLLAVLMLIREINERR